MADQKVSALTTIPAVDRATDLLYIVDTSGGTSNKVTPNSLLGISGDPVGTSDAQTLTNKTLTSPAISSPTLSGTIAGTYTLGGTPTFPSTVVSTTGTQTLTNKTLTSPTINTATIVNPTLTTDTISEYTSAAGVTIDGVLLKDAKMNGSYITDSTVGNSQLALGVAVQMVYATFTSAATGTTTIPDDDTIPQNTEGTEFMTATITPKSATNVLVIRANAQLSTNATNNYIGAIFRDSTASAVAAGEQRDAAGATPGMFTLEHALVAGSTAATTFKFRAGPDAAGTLTFNGASGSRIFGAITKSILSVTEYKA